MTYVSISLKQESNSINRLRMLDINHIYLFGGITGALKILVTGLIFSKDTHGTATKENPNTH